MVVAKKSYSIAATVASSAFAPREALIKFHTRDRGDSGRRQDGEDAV